MLKLHIDGRAGSRILREDMTGIISSPNDLLGRYPDLVHELSALCAKEGGVGIAAPQVGLRENFFFLTEGAKIPSRRPGAFSAHLCCNPSWDPSPKSRLDAAEEGCLSLPGRVFVASRHTSIEARWTNAVGHPQKKVLTGFAARVFQHEHDHLRGVLLKDHARHI